MRRTRQAPSRQAAVGFLYEFLARPTVERGSGFDMNRNLLILMMLDQAGTVIAP